MTEKEYVRTKALGTITAAINTLSDLVPENLKCIMTKKEYREVMINLSNWQSNLFDNIKTKD